MSILGLFLCGVFFFVAQDLSRYPGLEHELLLKDVDLNLLICVSLKNHVILGVVRANGSKDLEVQVHHVLVLERLFIVQCNTVHCALNFLKLRCLTYS